MTAPTRVSRRSTLATPLACVVLTGCFIGVTAAAGWWGVPIVAAVWGFWSRTKVQPHVAPGLTAAVCAVIAWGALLVWTAVVGPLPLLVRTLGTMFGTPGPVLLVFPLVLVGLLAWAATTAVRG